jgi:membrane protein YdbS with pleckstrin-like domain
MSLPDIQPAAVAEAPPVAAARAAPAKAAALELLDGGEIIELCIRPSPFLIVSLSWPIVLAASLLAIVVAVATGGQLDRNAIVTFQVLGGIAAIRTTVAALQWSTKLYVLTNRRVIRFRGVFSVESVECPLPQIASAELRVTPLQRLAGLGSIVMRPASPQRATVSWDQVASAADVHERLLRAIARASGRG